MRKTARQLQQVGVPARLVCLDWLIHEQCWGGTARPCQGNCTFQIVDNIPILEDVNVQYSVIYCVDIPSGVNMRPFVPPECKRLWDETEGDEQYDYGYLEGRWEQGHHRKWYAILDQEQFDEFVRHVGLVAEDVQTMGSLGAPGFGWGWAPAISFRNDDPDAIANAYVTPCGSKSEIVGFLRQHDVPVPCVLLDDDTQGYLWPEVIDREAPWEAVRRAVLGAYS